MDLQKIDSHSASIVFPENGSSIAWASVVIFAVALTINPIAIPFFILFWLSEWTLPTDASALRLYAENPANGDVPRALRTARETPIDVWSA